MIRIRCIRRRSCAIYDIVVVRLNKRKVGKVIEKLGFFNLGVSSLGKFAFIDLERLGYWLNLGASLSSRVLFFVGILSFYEAK